MGNTILQRNNLGLTPVYRVLHKSVGGMFSYLCMCLIFREEYRRLSLEISIVYPYFKNDFPEGVPTRLKMAVISSEDKRFYHHSGFDLISIFRSIYQSTLKGSPQGGSTIEQQLVRTLLGLHEKKIRRKIKEIFLASAISSLIPKEEVPDLYLYVAYMGWRMNGLKQALRRFNIDIKSISREEASSIAACLRHPLPHLPSAEKLRRHNDRALLIQKYIEKY